MAWPLEAHRARDWVTLPPVIQKARRPAIGWREWVAMPELSIPRIKVKVDTGARSSALHAFEVRKLRRNGETWVRFKVHPLQRDTERTVEASAPIVDERWVRSSSGRLTLRPVIETTVVLGERSWAIELTLVRRDLMGFRMLLGRQAVRRRFVVDPGRSFLAGRPLREAVAHEEPR
jgi:hypothetical protein